jgi:Uma2 family endonuclease
MSLLGQTGWMLWMCDMAIGSPIKSTEYPRGDGKPIAETWLHIRAIMLLHQALEDFFQSRPDVFIASDLFWYWEEGNAAACLAPDVMVVTGVAPRSPRERRSLLSWEEGGAVPAVVFEMASQNTWREEWMKSTTVTNRWEFGNTFYLTRRVCTSFHLCKGTV